MKKLQGTAYYIAPEVIMSEYNEKCDVWSIGVILYILLCGYPPFNGEDNDEIMESVKVGKFSFKYDAFNNVSSQAKDLIKKMLTKNPDKRPGCAQALKHEWFQVELENKAISEDLMQNLVKFKSQSKMQQAIFMFLINQTITQEERNSMMETFKKLDKNQDGVLSKEEIKEGLEFINIFLTEQEIENLMNQVDQNKNNQIDYSEFIAMTIDKKQALSEEKVESCFKMFDANNDGSIELKEFQTMLQGNQKVSNEVWRDLMFEITGNKDQQEINLDQFKQLLKKIS